MEAAKVMKRWDLTLVVNAVDSLAHREEVLQCVSDVMPCRQKGSLSYVGGSLLYAGCLVFVNEIPSRLGMWVQAGSLCPLKYLLIMSSSLSCLSHLVSVKT